MLLSSFQKYNLVYFRTFLSYSSVWTDGKKKTFGYLEIQQEDSLADCLQVVKDQQEITHGDGEVKDEMNL